MLKDAMEGFQLYQPTDIDAALVLMQRFGPDGWVLAGGYDSLDWFKDRGKAPAAVIDLEGVAELRGIRERESSRASSGSSGSGSAGSGGIEIGAMTTLTDVEQHSLVQDRYPLLAAAARRVASPQIRNAGTIGGNVCQDTRCWYYRYGVNCYRAGGNTCYASAPDAMNREHAIFGASRCVAVSPSDTAPALVALDAEMVVRNAAGERVIAAEDFFMGPAIDITRMTVLEPGDLLVSIRLPEAWADAEYHFEKVADRSSWDFALVSVAAAFRMDGAAVSDARVVCGAVQCVPTRLRSVERLVRGEARTEEIAKAAGVAAVRGAETLKHNGYKVPLMESLVTRAVRGS
jgi:xanthine dehydrogenase YagS FAD-binding subunit